MSGSPLTLVLIFNRVNVLTREAVMVNGSNWPQEGAFEEMHSMIGVRPQSSD
ncbi:hypothetical protein ANANG_G00227230 [Anguilla anguilla]|uniref:Uncharacterized protein n=1 Tax=Anguilla anguilla TaxID=7936 RepID=A0A9D3RQR0_ANGAN|nr:hypothetical protein ANANG_G00227230 [Anguilla anguilla]